MVARNAWGSNSRPFLEARRGRAEFLVLRDILSIGVWRAIFVEPLGSRGEAMGAPPLLHIQRYYTASAGASRYSRHRGRFPLIASVHEQRCRQTGAYPETGLWGIVASGSLPGALTARQLSRSRWERFCGQTRPVTAFHALLHLRITHNLRVRRLLRPTGG
jgi:hypothetical protein